MEAILIKLRRLLPLSYHVRKEIKNTLHTNESFRENRLNSFEKLIARSSVEYKKYILILLILFISSNIALYFYVNEIDVNKIIRPDVSWLGVFLTAQITIVGLIYPLVISFVSLLLADKAGKNETFPNFV